MGSEWVIYPWSRRVIPGPNLGLFWCLFPSVERSSKLGLELNLWSCLPTLSTVCRVMFTYSVRSLLHRRLFSLTISNIPCFISTLFWRMSFAETTLIRWSLGQTRLSFGSRIFSPVPVFKSIRVPASKKTFCYTGLPCHLRSFVILFL